MKRSISDSRRHWVSLGRVVLWLVALSAIILMLQALGCGRLSAPPITSFAQFQAWLENRDTATAAFALLRLGALLIAWYLLAATLLGLTVRRTGNPELVRLADRVTPRAVRRLVGAVAGLSISTSAATFVALPVVPYRNQPVSAAPSTAGDPNTPASDEPDGHRAVLRRLPDDGTVVMRRIPAPRDDHRNDGTATMQVIEGRPSAPQQPAVAPPATWTVEPGDHFWSVATRVLTVAWRRSPTDGEVLPYWRLLIAHNRDRLVDPGNPDLVFAGQVFELPAPPGAPPAR